MFKCSEALKKSLVVLWHLEQLLTTKFKNRFSSTPEQHTSLAMHALVKMFQNYEILYQIPNLSHNTSNNKEYNIN